MAHRHHGSTPMRILVYGAGVQGSLYAARLFTSRHEVVLVARGTRLAEIRAEGVVLEDVSTGRRTTTPVPAVARLEPEDAYDLVLVPVRREQISGVLPALAAARAVPAILFLHNHAGGSADLADAVGRERVLLGFPGAGGAVEHARHASHPSAVVRYVLIAQQPTTLGELDGRVTPRLRGVAAALRQAGFRVALSRRMDAWLTAHAVFVTAVSGALYRAAGGAGADAAQLAASREEVARLVRAVREGFRALQPRGLAAPPRNLRAIFTWVPTGVAVAYWRRFLARRDAEFVFARHARAAGAEMRSLADDLRRLLPDAERRTPTLASLWHSIDEYAARTVGSPAAGPPAAGPPAAGPLTVTAPEASAGARRPAEP